MGLFDLFKTIFSQPVSYGNVQNRSYKELPMRGGDAGSFMYSDGQSPTLDRLLARQNVQPEQPQILNQAALLQQLQSKQAQPTRAAQAAQIVQQALRQQSNPSYDYDAVSRFSGPAYTEGQNSNIDDDVRARALAFIAKNYGG